MCVTVGAVVHRRVKAGNGTYTTNAVLPDAFVGRWQDEGQSFRISSGRSMRPVTYHFNLEVNRTSLKRTYEDHGHPTLDVKVVSHETRDNDIVFITGECNAPYEESDPDAFGGKRTYSKGSRILIGLHLSDAGVLRLYRYPHFFDSSAKPRQEYTRR
ncbi:MAG: hypothetical protein H0X45_00405 [Planctomycetes bacterium]|nr:hypothetical protein [Planctomycetota bacterium]